MRTEDFMAFINEREQVRLRKEADLPFPWTEDEILRKYKFTNVRRHHDRTSNDLRQSFYSRNYTDDLATILMNAATFRYFGTTEFARAIGWTPFDEMTEEHWDRVKETARHRLKNKQRVFTGAYVITNQGISAPKQEVVVDYFLKGLQKAVPALINVVQETQSWRRLSEEMSHCIGFGGSGFMVKETLLDTTYTGFWADQQMTEKEGMFSFPMDWMNYTPIGPGARRGAARVNGDDEAKPVKYEDANYVIFDLLLDANNGMYHHGKLAPHDIQFQLCEFDKYERVRLGQGRPRSMYRP